MIERVFSIAICRQSDDKWQLKSLFLTILYTFVDSINVFDCRLSGVIVVGVCKVRFKDEMYNQV